MWQQPPQISALQTRVSELILDNKRDQADAIMREACLHQVRAVGAAALRARRDRRSQPVGVRPLHGGAGQSRRVLDLWSRGHYKSRSSPSPRRSRTFSPIPS
jgi:hypothetical protein